MLSCAEDDDDEADTALIQPHPSEDDLEAGTGPPFRGGGGAVFAAFCALGGIACFALAWQQVDEQDATARLRATVPPRALQTELCNPMVQPPQPVSSAFNMPGDWASSCFGGQGVYSIKPPPSETEKYPGQQNWCWNWMKHKGCLDLQGAMNWRDAQVATAAAHLAPDPAVGPMVPVRNPGLCENYDLGATVPAKRYDIEAAKAWLDAFVVVYVIALPAEADRKQAMKDRLDELGIRFIFLDGVDLRIAGSYAKAKIKGIIPLEFNYQKASTNGDGVGGAVGCAAAHLGAMRTISMSGQRQPLAVVLEDDVTLEEDFAVKLYSLITTEAPCDWEVISLKSACPFGECVSPHLTRVMPDLNEPEARCHHGVNYGFYGMVYKVQTLDDVRSRLGQRVWNHDIPHCLDVDVALASISDQVGYYAVPYWQVPGFLQVSGHGSARGGNHDVQVDTTEPW